MKTLKLALFCILLIPAICSAQMLSNTQKVDVGDPVTISTGSDSIKTLPMGYAHSNNYLVARNKNATVDTLKVDIVIAKQRNTTYTVIDTAKGVGVFPVQSTTMTTAVTTIYVPASTTGVYQINVPFGYQAIITRSDRVGSMVVYLITGDVE